MAEYPLLLSSLAEAHSALGDIERARSYAEEALRLVRSYGKPLYATTYISNLAYFHELRGDWRAAERLYREALDITEAELCKDHPDTLVHQEDLARMYWRQRKYAEALPVYERVIDEYQAKDDYAHERVAVAYSHLGDIHLREGRLDDAEAMYQAALSPDISTPDGLEHTEGCFRPSVELARPWDFFEWNESLATGTWFKPTAKVFPRCKRYGERRRAMHDLANIYMTKGELHKARALYEKLLELTRATEQGREVLDATLDLARLHAQQGDLDNAEQLYAEALALISGNVSLQLRRTSALREQARLNLSRKRYAKAKEIIERAMHEDRQDLPADHPDIADDLDIMAEVHLHEGSSTDAIDAWTAAIEINLGLGSARGRALMRNYAGLGRAQLRRGQRTAAKRSFKKALAVGAELPDAGPEMMSVYSGLTTAYWLDGDLSKAQSSVELIVAQQDVQIASLITAKDESRMLAAVEASRHTVHQALSLHFSGELWKNRTKRFTTELALNRKGNVVGLLSSSYPMVHENFSHDSQGLVKRALAARAKVAMFALRGTRRSSLGPGFIFGLREARKKQQAIESFLLGSIRPQTPSPVKIEDVQSVLQPDDALVEFLWYVPFDPSAESESESESEPEPEPKSESEPEPEPESATEPRYAACVIRNEQFKWIDLGPAAEIDASIRSFSQDIIGRSDITESGRRLHQALIAPLLPHLEGARRLLLSPDGEMRRVSFATIPTEDGKYLLEDYLVHYLNAGRDLLRPWSRFEPSVEPGLAIANPKGARLPGTNKEAQILRDIFRGIDIWDDREATESKFRGISRPWMLHIGAHGFSQDEQRRSMGSQLDPMIFSGLKMAEPTLRAKDTAEGPDDGLLSAYEISWLDLRGTQLVTLSACSSGLGAIEAGEGVLGLQRSIAIAGAQSVVMSLWDVSDEATPWLMKQFYRSLRDGQSRDQAMQRAQLEFLRCQGREHPYFWGSFVVTGEWGPLTLPSKKRRERGLGDDEDVCPDAQQ
ncbi:MAG: CHAT domain-containing protein [Myxococcota bacterium]